MQLNKTYEIKHENIVLKGFDAIHQMKMQSKLFCTSKKSLVKKEKKKNQTVFSRLLKIYCKVYHFINLF